MIKIQEIPPAQNWRKILSRGKYPLLFIYELNQGLLGTHKVTGFKVKMTSYCRVQGGSYIYEEEAQAFIQELRKVLQKSPRMAFSWIRQYFHYTKELLNWLQGVNAAVKKQQLDKEALKKIYRQYEKRMLIIWRWGYLPFLIDDAIALEFNDLLTKLGLQPGKIAEALKILTVSPKLTLHQREEIELLQLAAKVKKFGLGKLQKQIKGHLTKWAWKQSWIYSQHHLTVKDLEAEILNLAKKNPTQILLKLKKERAKKLEARKRFLARFKNEKLETLANILAEYAFWHSYKMEELTKAVYLVKPLLSQLAKEFGLSYNKFVELIPREVEKEKINLKIINERVKENGVVMMKGKWQAIWGKEVRQVKERIEKQPTDSKVLRGFVTFRGKASGRAVIVSEAINIAKVKINPGDILVVSMTTTNMVPLVKIAGAVVTDEGGVLCHAAIITRELKKPCVIGTRFATKIFKTGDRVEVDADKGTVRKI